MAQTNVERVLESFDRRRKRNARLVAAFVEETDVEATMDRAREVFEAMIPGMAYVEAPDKPMADSLFECNAVLAVFLLLRERGVDAHAFGGELLHQMRAAERRPQANADPAGDTGAARQRFAAFIAAGKASQRDAKPGEFVFEAFVSREPGTDWGMNVKSCAICHSFAKHDAAELVPYMCATDDVNSDRGNRGLRRSGSIAVGATRCDFRYKQGGEPQHLAPLYPRHIRPGRAR